MRWKMPTSISWPIRKATTEPAIVHSPWPKIDGEGGLLVGHALRPSRRSTSRPGDKPIAAKANTKPYRISATASQLMNFTPLRP
jgi:hypothetical protein